MLGNASISDLTASNGEIEFMFEGGVKPIAVGRDQKSTLAKNEE